MSKIIQKSVIKREPGKLYFIDAKGNVCEADMKNAESKSATGINVGNFKTEDPAKIKWIDKKDYDKYLVVPLAHDYGIYLKQFNAILLNDIFHKTLSVIKFKASNNGLSFGKYLQCIPTIGRYQVNKSNFRGTETQLKSAQEFFPLKKDVAYRCVEIKTKTDFALVFTNNGKKVNIIIFNKRPGYKEISPKFGGFLNEKEFTNSVDEIIKRIKNL